MYCVHLDQNGALVGRIHCCAHLDGQSCNSVTLYIHQPPTGNTPIISGQQLLLFMMRVWLHKAIINEGLMLPACVLTRKRKCDASGPFLDSSMK